MSKNFGGRLDDFLTLSISKIFTSLIFTWKTQAFHNFVYLTRFLNFYWKFCLYSIICYLKLNARKAACNERTPELKDSLICYSTYHEMAGQKITKWNKKKREFSVIKLKIPSPLVKYPNWHAADIQNITWPRWDTNFILECWKHLSWLSEANEILSAREDKILIPKRPCNVLFIL